MKLLTYFQSIPCGIYKKTKPPSLDILANWNESGRKCFTSGKDSLLGHIFNKSLAGSKITKYTKYTKDFQALVETLSLRIKHFIRLPLEEGNIIYHM